MELMVYRTRPIDDLSSTQSSQPVAKVGIEGLRRLGENAGRGWVESETISECKSSHQKKEL